MAKLDLSADRLRELLTYDPNTGDFIWKKRRNQLATRGSVAGTVMNKGYIHVMIDGRSYLAHRLAWLYVTGRWPSNYIDHVSGVKTDNRISNLREATFCENQHNTVMRSTNTSGVKGVSFSKQHKTWVANVTLFRRKRYLGLFSSIADASRAVMVARERLHGEYANHGDGIVHA